MLTIFSAPKSFADPHTGQIQRNAIQSWRDLGPQVEVLLVGDESGMSRVADELKVQQVEKVERNAHGTPRIDSIFQLAEQVSTQPLLAYVNADVLLMPDFLEAAKTALKAFDTFLVIGQRWDLDVREPLTVGAEGSDALRQRALSSGKLHPPGGSDYFIFPRGCYSRIPGFAVGRAGWDNWMIYHARRQGWPVIDATATVMPVHQIHSYAHLPNGQPHHRHPESSENLRLAGGNRRIFRLPDATFQMVEGRIVRRSWTTRRILLEAERIPVLRFNSDTLAAVVFAVFHPIRAWREVRGMLAYLLGKYRRPVESLDGGE